MLPSAQVDCVGVLIASFRSSIPSPPIPLFTLRNTPHGALRKTRGRVVRYSFLVGILPPLLHTGLARRTGSFCFLQRTIALQSLIRASLSTVDGSSRRVPHPSFLCLDGSSIRKQRAGWWPIFAY